MEREAIRILLFDSLIRTILQKSGNSKMICVEAGHRIKKQWTIILDPLVKKIGCGLVKTTQEKEVVFECLFRNYGGGPKICSRFLRFRGGLDDKKQTYDITPKDFEGYAAGSDSVVVADSDQAKKAMVKRVLLIRLEDD